MTYIVLQNIHHVAMPKAPKTLFKSPPFSLMITVLECALLIALRSLNFLAGIKKRDGIIKGCLIRVECLGRILLLCRL
ncbi:hypothetical protein AB3S75_013235 [Citrus x aurantiifolia]